jgi:hypothetical protein
MKLLIEHFYTAFLIGSMGWVVSGDFYCVLAALVAGWLIDFDHLYDCFIYFLRNKKLSIDLIKTGEYFARNNMIIVPLHSWEITLVLMLMGVSNPSYCAPLISASIAHGAHLLQDQWTYRVRLYGYFFVSRMNQKFAHQGFCRARNG